MHHVDHVWILKYFFFQIDSCCNDDNKMSIKYIFNNRQKSIVPLFQTIIRSCYFYPTDTGEGNFEKKHFANRSKNEPLPQKKARLIYQSRKRGNCYIK